MGLHSMYGTLHGCIHLILWTIGHTPVARYEYGIVYHVSQMTQEYTFGKHTVTLHPLTKHHPASVLITV